MTDGRPRHEDTPQEKESLARELESTDKRIDSLVYELYGLSDEEIRIVEG
ncbi:MAG: restriction endonuclease [Chloroflexi bacterium]|nr:restriction endonuclease [Chloroflexota bacterium]